jgi:hypothetical protein
MAVFFHDAVNFSLCSLPLLFEGGEAVDTVYGFVGETADIPLYELPPVSGALFIPTAISLFIFLFFPDFIYFVSHYVIIQYFPKERGYDSTGKPCRKGMFQVVLFPVKQGEKKTDDEIYGHHGEQVI